MISTNLLYFRSNNLQTTATIRTIYPAGEFEDDDRPSVVLSDTIFQFATKDRLADFGTIDGTPVVHVARNHFGEVRHHFDGPENRFRIGAEVSVTVARQPRDWQSRLLCAGRLIEAVGPLVSTNLEPIDADFRPHRSRIDFGCRDYVPTSDSLLAGFCREIDACVKANLPICPVEVDGAFFRRVKIGDISEVVCYGIYPNCLQSIGPIAITRILVIGGRIQVRFRVFPNLETH